MTGTSDGVADMRRRTRWPLALRRLVDIAVLPDDRPDVVATKRLFTAALWLSLVTSAFSIYQFYALDAPVAAAVVGIPVLPTIISLVAMRMRPTTYPGVMHLVALGTLVTTSLMIVLLGGIFESAGNSVWALLVIVGAAAIFADRRAHIWAAAFVVFTVSAYFVSQNVDVLYELPARGYLALYNLIAVGLFIYGVLYYFVRQTGHLYAQSEGLLRNVLPDEIASRLKESDEMIADRFDSASILFADVAGFTPMSARLEPEAVVTLLNEVFTEFDALVDERDLEKIKTIGDAYMVASGVPVPRQDHARAICDLALELLDHLATREFGGHRLQMRIGVASGPVTAGIIGRKKFAYDLWGDTVNLASRMESSGMPGRIQLAGATAALVSPWFTCESRGEIEVKGKGRMESWWLVGAKEVSDGVAGSSESQA